MKRIDYLLIFLLCLFNQTIYAEQKAIPQGVDNRIQLFSYDASDVFAINTQIGYSNLIQLEVDEEIDELVGGVGMGDAEKYSLAVRGNNIFFKPIAEMNDTNLIVVTNKRTYAFLLTNIPHLPPTYIARFTYPQEQEIKEQSKLSLPQYLLPVTKDSYGNDIWIDADINTHYVYRGDKTLKPTNIWDNGRFTYLRFNHAGDLPTVYRVLPDNSEVLVNTHIEADKLVLQEIGYVYRLRFGKTVGEIGNQKQKSPKFNTDGTSDKNFVRINN